jgi:hypothetical protein
MTEVRERAAPERPLESQSAQYIDESELLFTATPGAPGTGADLDVDSTTNDGEHPVQWDSRLRHARGLPDLVGGS